MKCPKCGAGKVNIKVVGTLNDYLTFTHRYLKCKICMTSFQTKEIILYETVEETSLPEEETDC